MSPAPRPPRDTAEERAAQGGAVKRAGTRAPAAAAKDTVAYRRHVAAGRAARRQHAERRRTATRRRLLAATLVMLAAAVAAVLALLPGLTGHGPADTVRAASGQPAPSSGPSSYAVGLEVLRLVEPGRTVTLADGATEPRTLETWVRYPALGSSRATDVAGATPATAYGPFPLVVFGHGFEETPETYRLLLQSWARAGFVVVAPAFPLERAGVPGGSEESDLVNEPGDVSFLISHILAESASGSGTLAGLVDPSEIAVAGHSDGGDTALAVGYGQLDGDPRVKAVIVLSGAEGRFREGIEFSPGSPPLLATQGTADPINKPSETSEFFEAARAPKYLLTLEGAGHLLPYTDQQPQLEVVERATISFLYAYLEHWAPALRRLRSAGNVPGVATLVADAPPFSG